MSADNLTYYLYILNLSPVDDASEWVYLFILTLKVRDGDWFIKGWDKGIKVITTFKKKKSLLKTYKVIPYTGGAISSLALIQSLNQFLAKPVTKPVIKSIFKPVIKPVVQPPVCSQALS